ncbi:KR domain protein [Leptospira ryugenii]|uniref:KR domain protein n=1 Tax=Leptospira ryugenii TaxID=1917863 RepID=A0A2P2DZM8_9LEPT|nr:SDR family NAD(P)-dependent oxidoreductase [Leptospira ryugenii]GBF50082.1 KR domain protein [Leptospira ryugenii]
MRKQSGSAMKTALVLGASSDIAKHIVYELQKKHINLQLTGTNLQVLEQTFSGLVASEAQKIQFFSLDIRNKNQFIRFLEQLDPFPDVVYSAIGYYKDQMDLRYSLQELSDTIEINFSGLVALLSLIANRMEERKFGQIVVLSSVAGERGRQLNYGYGSTKAALTVFLSGLRNRLHKANVQITTVLLGPVYTKMSKGHKLFPIITLQAPIAAKKIVEAGEKYKDEVYIHWIWRWIMLLIKIIPEGIFKRLPPF